MRTYLGINDDQRLTYLESFLVSNLTQSQFEKENGGNESWYYSRLRKIFTNEVYKGDILTHKTIRLDYINKKAEVANVTRQATEDILNQIVLRREKNLKLITIFTVLTIAFIICIFDFTILFLIFSNILAISPIKNFIHKINSDEKLPKGISRESYYNPPRFFYI